MRIAHFSDLHVLALDGVGWERYANKRLTGVANLALRRAPLDELSGAWHAVAARIPARFKKKHVHRTEYVRALAREISRTHVDHVVVTGDVSNLALQTEFQAVRDILEGELHLDPHDVSLIPGNHDVYTRGALREHRFSQFFAHYTHSDIDLGATFPYVRLRGPCAIIGLCSAVPQPPFVAAGILGSDQLDAFSRALAHPEVKRRTPVILIHHPPEGPASRVKHWMEGLRDGPAFVARLSGLARGLVLHGHLHERMQSPIITGAGVVTVAGAASASLHHDHEARMSGFNVYEIDDHTGEIRSISAHVRGSENQPFHVERVPDKKKKARES